MSTIKHLSDELSAYLDDQLSAAERGRVEMHLRTCAQCRRDLETLQYTIRTVRALPPVHAPRSFTLTEEQAARARPWWQRARSQIALRAVTAVAAVMLIAVCGVDFLSVGRLGGYGAAAPAPSVLSAPSRAQGTEPSDQADAQPRVAVTQAAAPPSGAQAAAPTPLSTGVPAAQQAPVAAGTPAGSPTFRPGSAEAVVTPTMSTGSTVPVPGGAVTPAPAASQTPPPPASPATQSKAASPEPGAAPSPSPVFTTGAPAGVPPLRVVEIGLAGLVVIGGASLFLSRIASR